MSEPGKNIRNHNAVKQSPTSDYLTADPPFFEPDDRANPDVRAEKVALGKRLVADPNFPSRAVLEKIARLLARNLPNPGEAAPPSED